MAESLGDLLTPYLGSPTGTTLKDLSPTSPAASKYLTRLTTLSIDALHTTEPQSLAQSAHSVNLSLQALANRSNRSIITAADSFSTLKTSLPIVIQESEQLRDAVPKLDEEAVRFSTTYSKAGQNAILDRRKQALLLSRNVDRLSDILELPTLLSTAISSVSAAGPGSGTNSGVSYSSALDLFAHIKRLQTLYPTSTIVKGVLDEAEEAMNEMTSNLIASLRSQQNIRLAAAIRTIGWLRRVAPDLSTSSASRSGQNAVAISHNEGSFGALFLVCRLANLLSMLEALAPLRDLADQETERRKQTQVESMSGQEGKTSKSGLSRTRSDFYGQQSERYLKRYIEIFREQSFSTISMYKNIFPDEGEGGSDTSGGLLPLPAALHTFPLHLVELLTETLKTYMPNIKDGSARESLLTQVLYTAGSLGRLGADFGLIIALIEGDAEASNSKDKAQGDVLEWQMVMKKHRVQAGRLEALASGHGMT
ncbi:putative dor1-like family protein [Phaeomoniella chlamydospora]|uniref:Conserved oligomeric Golgi complex subunit 8 n=1 Tax=Phaeomoniella chlamydospora TaxID=158046 RepID=A0A0G2GLB8_PHACM|nr:putative dor1-like family protein [Phaeomoniella chlamydospora]